MKTIICADLHFSSYSQDRMNAVTRFPERLNGLNSAMESMITYGKTMHKITTVTILGDTFHNKSIIHSVAQSAFLDLIRKHRDILFIILDGNHDMSSMTGDGVSATKCLDNEKNVKTIHETTTIDNVLFVPWNPLRMVQDIKFGKAEYLMSHLGLNEAILNSGISLVSDIGLNDIKQYKKTYLGHYHYPQTAGNATYVGSLIHLDGNDKNQEKRFIIFDSNTGEEESIPTIGYKKYCEFDINKENKDAVLKKVFDLKSEGHHIKLNKIDDVDVTDFKDDFSIVNRVEVDITNRGITSGMSSADKLDRYMEIKGISIEKLSAYKNIALDIIDKVSSEVK